VVAFFQKGFLFLAVLLEGMLLTMAVILTSFGHPQRMCLCYENGHNYYGGAPSYLALP
jgi:hypothetical protein